MKKYLFSIVVMLITIFSGAQVPWPGDISPFPPNPEELEVRTGGSPSIPLTCSNQTIFDFQEVLVEESATRELLLRNTGAGLLFINDIEIVGSDDFSVILDFDFGDELYGLTAGEEVSFLMQFEPSSLGKKRPNLLH